MEAELAMLWRLGGERIYPPPDLDWGEPRNVTDRMIWYHHTYADHAVRAEP